MGPSPPPPSPRPAGLPPKRQPGAVFVLLGAATAQGRDGPAPEQLQLPWPSPLGPGQAWRPLKGQWLGDQRFSKRRLWRDSASTRISPTSPGGFPGGPPRAWPQGPGLQARSPEYRRRWTRSCGQCVWDPLLCWGTRSTRSGVLAVRAGLAGRVAPEPCGWGQSEGGRLARWSSRRRKGRWGRGPRGAA